MALVNTEMESLRKKTVAPDNLISLANQAKQKLADFQTRITSIHDEFTALSSMVSAEASFTSEQKAEVSANLAEIVAIKTAIDKLAL